LHREGGADGGRGQAEDRVLAMRRTLLAHAFRIAGTAQDTLLAREADRGDAGDHLRHAASYRHRGVLEGAGDETAVRPALMHVVDFEPVYVGHAVVIGAERPAHVQRQSVDVAPLDACIGERRAQGLRAEAELADWQVAAELAMADADDCHLAVEVHGPSGENTKADLATSPGRCPDGRMAPWCRPSTWSSFAPNSTAPTPPSTGTRDNAPLLS